ncbi:MAG TPA: hypothetical protein VFW15_06440 [Thermoanaerobaculia bacterium]|nr:hypothetical protein [Thermoanaerobaculia bacterium]
MGILHGIGARKAVVAREDWILLVVGASDGLLPVQLQKALFLLGQRFPELSRSGFYEFRPVSSGDFSEQVYADATALLKKGLVSIRSSESEGSRKYRLTRSGVERASRIERLAPPAIAQSLRRIVAWVGTRSLAQLLRRSSAASAAPAGDPWDLTRLPSR